MHRTGRSPLFQQLKQSFRNANSEGTNGAAKRGISRRSALAGAAATILTAYSQAARAQTDGPRVAVVGAGIAGLNATYLLANAGFQVTLYEGSDHIGGRIQTAFGAVAPDVFSELGGEFIDTVHGDMMHLAKLFHLDLIDTQAPTENGLQVAYYADGKIRSEAEVIAAFKPLAAIVDRDSSQLSDSITFDSHSPFDAKLDNTNLQQYLQRNVSEKWLYDVLEAAYVNEFGLELEEQSALNFVETIGTDTSSGFQVYGISDQRYKIRGGNHQIVAALANAVSNRTQLGNRLDELSVRSTGEYRLRFHRVGMTDQIVDADIVVLCLPFTTLREVELHLPLPAIKLKAIDELGYGTNAKLILGFQDKRWRESGYSGDSYCDQAYQSGWDSSRDQRTKAGAYTIFPGGTKAVDLRPGTSKSQANRLLPGLDTVFPGVQKHWLGTSLRAYWPDNPFVRGSYASYLPGQWTGIRGAEGMRVDNLFFAGEHTSLNWQGYMNGGAESGRLAAQAIIG